MKLYLMAGLLVFLFCSCNGKNGSKQPMFIDKLKHYIPKDKGSMYFPLDSILFVSDKDNRHGDSSIKAMYSEMLFNLQEPILYNYLGEQEVIRFLWMRPFDNPVVVRVNKFQDTIYANIKELMNVSNDADHYIPKIKLDTTIMLNTKKWEDILSFMAIDNFWNASVADTLHDYNDVTLWVLECRFRNKYHCIDRTYIDSSSFKNFEYAKVLFDIGNEITPMKNSREANIK